MSRFAGLLSEKQPQAISRMIALMLDALKTENHKERGGVDGRGEFALGWLGLGLGGIFLSPAVAVAIDGCIYNRADFEKPGRPEKNDAEILAALYEERGFEDALRGINGDFAVALYDFRDCSLWLGRDRFGVKPLYYVSRPDYCAFASRPRALLSLPGVSTEANRRYVALFAASHYRYIDNDPRASPYADVTQLPAANVLRFKDGSVKIARYCELKDLPDYCEDEDELAARYHGLLLDAVNVRLQRARDPAFTLSGGMDSSSVLMAATELTRRRQPAFSTVYTDKTYDETNEIQSMLEATVNPWRPVKVDSPDVFALVKKMIQVNEEPVATATWLSHYLLCREVRDSGFHSLFGGLGGDELNAGEYEYFFFHFADLRLAGNEERLLDEVRLWARYHDHPIYRKNISVMEEGLRRMVDFSVPGQCLPEPRRMRRYYNVLTPDYYKVIESFWPVMEHPFKSYLKNRTYQDLYWETLPCCLRAEDRQTMAFGLDHFLPFLDHRLVEFMFRVPGTMKIRDGITKYLLRKAMRGILPEATRTRIKKTGWNAPAHVWFAGKGKDLLLDLVHSKAFRERGIYNVTEVGRLIQEHDVIVTSGCAGEDHMMFLWQLVNLELWFQEVVDRRSVSATAVMV